MSGGHAASTAFQISGARVSFAKRSEFELTFPDPVRELDTSDGDRGSSSEPLQPKHWAQAKLDRSMILFNEVVQVFSRTNLSPRAALMLGEEFARRSMRSLVAIERDGAGQSALAFERPMEKSLRGGDIPLDSQ
nr:hypothetical protein [Methylocystis sp. MJC1]